MPPVKRSAEKKIQVGQTYIIRGGEIPPILPPPPVVKKNPPFPLAKGLRRTMKFHSHIE